MGIFKGALSIILILILSFSSFLQVTASNVNLESKRSAVKQIILAKNTLLQTKNGVKYINAMDKLAEKLKSNPQKLEKISKKVNTVIKKLKVKKYSGKTLSRNEQIILNILTYLQKRIQFIELNNIKKEKSKKENALNIILEAAKNPNISDSDKEKINSAIINVQEKLLNTAEKNISNILSDFEKYYNYENKGDFEMSYNIDQKQIGKINAEMKISDYIIQNNNFDTRMKGKLSALFKSTSQDNKITQGEISSIVDFIAKDGNYFALLKDLNITTNEDIESIQETINTLKKLAKENKYIEISDPANKKLIEILQSFNPDIFFKDAKKIAQKAMFTAYKKEGNTYFILPTKYACDTLKVITNKFDPFSPKNCTENQYNDFISDMLSVGELTLTLGKENTLEYTLLSDKYIDKGNFSITYNNINITKISANLIPNQVKNPNEKVTFEYKRNKYLNAYIYAEKGNISLNFKSILDRKNNFSSISYTQNFIDRNDTITSQFNLKNKKFTGELIVKTQNRKYDYKSGKYIQQGESIINLQLLGKINSRNNIEKIDLTVNGKDNNEVYLDGTLKYERNKTTMQVMLDNTYFQSDVNFNGKWDSRNKTFSQFDSNIEVFSKQREYNSDTYSYESTGEKTKTFALNYELNNRKLTGNISTWNQQGESVVKINSNGTYKKNKLQLNNIININTKYTPVSIEKENPIMYLNFGYDYTNNKNNIDIFINITSEGNNIFKFILKNKGTIEYKKVDIKKPIKTTPYKEVFSNLY